MIKYKKLKLVNKKASFSKVDVLNNSFNSTAEDNFTKILI